MLPDHECPALATRLRGLQVGLRLIAIRLRLLQIALGDGFMLLQIFGSIVIFVGELEALTAFK